MTSSHLFTPPETAPGDCICEAAVVGGGPAGLMAAEVLAQAGVAVQVFDAMPSVGRKFLLAGKGGLNLTHSEPFEPFAARLGARRAHIEPLLYQSALRHLLDMIFVLLCERGERLAQLDGNLERIRAMLEH